MPLTSLEKGLRRPSPSFEETTLLPLLQVRPSIRLSLKPYIRRQCMSKVVNGRRQKLTAEKRAPCIHLSGLAQTLLDRHQLRPEPWRRAGGEITKIPQATNIVAPRLLLNPNRQSSYSRKRLLTFRGGTVGVHRASKFTLHKARQGRFHVLRLPSTCPKEKQRPGHGSNFFLHTY